MVLGGPLSHVMAAKAVALAEARQPSFADLRAARSPTTPRRSPRALLRRGAALVTGGTDNHLVLLDVDSFGLTGRQAESALLDAGIVTNRNSIPADPNGAWYTTRHPPRHPGADHARLRRRRVRPGGRADRRRAHQHRTAAAASGPSKAKYTLADGTAERVHAAAAELLAANPLYPGLTL